MNQIKKHTFEAVSLLTADNGLLDVTVVPAMNQPDWLIPSNLILDVVAYNERVWTYLWNNQEIAVFHLTPSEIKPETILVLEGNTDVHRIALQTVDEGELQRMRVRISNVKDVAMPTEYLDMVHQHSMIEEVQTDTDDEDANITDEQSEQDLNEANSDDKETDSSYYISGLMSDSDGHFDENLLKTYVFQCVEVNGEIYVIPDLDKIAHHLVDLDD